MKNLDKGIDKNQLPLTIFLKKSRHSYNQDLGSINGVGKSNAENDFF